MVYISWIILVTLFGTYLGHFISDDVQLGALLGFIFGCITAAMHAVKSVAPRVLDDVFDWVDD